MAGIEQDFKELFDEIKSLLSLRNSNTPTQINSEITDGGYQAPIKGSWKSSGGFSTKPTDARHPKGHMGLDLRAPGGTTVYPIADGVVSNVGTDPVGGNVVNVDHANGVRSYYAHLGTIKVHKGDKVNKNTEIASVGMSGNAANTVPHVHLQIWKDNQIRNPADFFSVPAYEPMQKDEKRWLDGAEEVAKNWNLQQHLSQKSRTAVASKNEELIKSCDIYFLKAKNL